MQDVPTLIALSRMTGGARKPAEFLCLVLKLLQIQPDKEIIIEYIKNEDYKYVRVLGGLPSCSPAALPLSGCHQSTARDSLKCSPHNIIKHLACQSCWRSLPPSTSIYRCILPAAGGQAAGGVPIPGAPVQ